MFTVAWVTDTHTKAGASDTSFAALCDWLVANADTLNLSMVVHTGDFVLDGRDEAQFQLVEPSTDKLHAAGIPFLPAVGNHDYDNDLKVVSPANPGRVTTRFNEYIGWDKIAAKPYLTGYYESGKADNIYSKLTVDGRKLLFLQLEFGPRLAVMEWAQGICDANPDYSVILGTHGYVFPPVPRRYQTGDAGVATAYPEIGEAYDAAAMWTTFVESTPNIVMVLSGHWQNNTLSTQPPPANGIYETKFVSDHSTSGQVWQLFHNWQDGLTTAQWLGERIVLMSFDGDDVTFSTLRVNDTTYETGDAYNFTLTPTWPELYDLDVFLLVPYDLDVNLEVAESGVFAERTVGSATWGERPVPSATWSER